MSRRTILLVAACLTSVGAGTNPDTLVEAIAEIRSATHPGFSPDASRLAFVSNASGQPQVWVMPASGDAPQELTRHKDPVLSVHWSPKGDWLAYEVAPGGGLNVQVHVMRPDGSESRQLTAAGNATTRLAGWNADGRALRIVSNARNAAHLDAFFLSVPAGTLTPIVEGEGWNTITDVSADGRHAAVVRLQKRGNSNLYLIDLRKGAETLLTPHEGTATFGWGQFSPDGRRLYATSNDNRDLSAFVAMDLRADSKPGKQQVLAERNDAEAASAVLDTSGTRAALLWNVAGRNELDLFDMSARRVTHRVALPVDILAGLNFSEDGSKLALVGSGAAAPENIYVIDTATAKVTRLTNSTHDGVDLAAFSIPELIRYQAHDGVPLSGWLYRARNARGAGPVVFNYHGGPEGQARPTMNVLNQALVSSGITVFAPNVRGSGGFGKRFLNLDNGALRVNAIRDIKSTSDHLVKSGIADPKRMGIVGSSYGGYMVMAAVTEFPSLFSAGANLFGMVNFQTFFKHTEPWMAEISKSEYGDPVRDAAILEQLSPIHRLDRITTPLIVLHGANDTNVPLIEAEQIAKSLRARRIPLEYIVFPDEGHGWRKTGNRTRSTVAIVRFFSEHLKP